MKTRSVLTVILASSVVGCLLALLAPTAGCTTTTTVTTTNGVTTTNTTKTLDVAKTAAAAKAIAAAGAALAVQHDKNCAGYLEAAAILLEESAAAGTCNATNIVKALEKMTVNELKTPEAEACIVAAFAVYDAFAADVVAQKLDAAVWLRPVMLAVAEGIKSVLK